MLTLVLLLVAAPGGTRLDVGVGTVAPVFVGAHSVLELPGRLVLGADVGVMPPAYVAANNAFHDDGFDQDPFNDARQSGFVRATMRDALVLRPSIGFRPIPWSGMELMAGYTYIHSLKRERVSSPAETDSYKPTVEAFTFTLEWAWWFSWKWALRTGLGYMVPFHASLSKRVESSSGVGPFHGIDGEAKYKDIFRSPTLTFALCYRFE